MKTKSSKSRTDSRSCVPHPIRYRRFLLSEIGEAAISSKFESQQKQQMLSDAFNYVSNLCNSVLRAEFVSIVDVTSLLEVLPQQEDLSLVRLGNLALGRQVYLHFGRREQLLIYETGVAIDGVYARKTVYGDIELEFTLDYNEFDNATDQSIHDHVLKLASVTPVLVDGREGLSCALEEIRDFTDDSVVHCEGFTEAYWAAIKCLLYLSGDAPDLELPTKGGTVASPTRAEFPGAERLSDADERMLYAGRSLTVVQPLPKPTDPIEQLGRSRSMLLPLVPRGEDGLDLEQPITMEAMANIATELVRRGIVPTHEALARIEHALLMNSATKP